MKFSNLLLTLTILLSLNVWAKDDDASVRVKDKEGYLRLRPMTSIYTDIGQPWIKEVPEEFAGDRVVQFKIPETHFNFTPYTYEVTRKGYVYVMISNTPFPKDVFEKNGWEYVASGIWGWSPRDREYIIMKKFHEEGEYTFAVFDPSEQQRGRMWFIPMIIFH